MILLSFDTEEFDVPKEHGVNISLKEGVEVSKVGVNKILDILKAQDIHATFFCTVNFAENAPEEMRRIREEGHEIASHGWDHWTFEVADLKRSKDRLEEITGSEVTGYRQARMMPVPEEEIQKAGYLYNSSLNPTFIPGRYMHFNTPRTHFMKAGVRQIPASVSAHLRFPFFWLSYHHLPAGLYRAWVKRTLKHDGYFVTYFHPWEFYPLTEHPEYKMPYLIRHHSGADMERRLSDFISYFKKAGYCFLTYEEFVKGLGN